MSIDEVASLIRSIADEEFCPEDLDKCTDYVHQPDIEQEKVLNDEIRAMGKKESRAWASYDVKGNGLDPSKVAEARRVEIE